MVNGRLLEPPVMDADAVRGQVLLEESREAVVVLDQDDVVLVASRQGAPVARRPRRRRARPPTCSTASARSSSRTASTAARSGSSTSPRPAISPPTRSCARASPPPSRTSCGRRSRGCSRCSSSPAFRARTCRRSSSRRVREIDQIRELIDEVLFLAELESGTRVVSLGAEPVLPVLHEVAAELEEQAARAGVALRVEGDEDATAEVRPRMLRVVARNLAENAIRYAGPGANATLSVDERRRRRRAPRRRRRRRRRPGRPAAPLRALLPGRPLARLARHGTRARDREARRRLRGRHGRGARRSRPGLEIRCSFPTRS